MVIRKFEFVAKTQLISSTLVRTTCPSVAPASPCSSIIPCTLRSWTIGGLVQDIPGAFTPPPHPSLHKLYRGGGDFGMLWGERDEKLEFNVKFSLIPKMHFFVHIR